MEGSMLKIPIFRRYRGDTLPETEAMLYSKLRGDMDQQSLDSGSERKETPRFDRRGCGNVANGDAPDPVRDQMMRHDPQFMTFQSAYLNQIVNFDIQNTFLEEEKETHDFADRYFAEGPVPASKDDNTLASFVNDFVHYVKSHNLSNVIGLQFLGPIKDDSQSILPTAEFELGKKGTIVLPTSIVKGWELVPTSWPGASWPSAGKPTDAEPPAGQSWAEKVVNGVKTHQVFVS